MAASEVAEGNNTVLRLPGSQDSVSGLVYVPSIDGVIVSTKEGRLSVYDAHSRKLLYHTDVSSRPLSCVYHDHVQKLVATDGRNLGARRDLEGMIFLPSLLQPRCGNSEEVTIEIPASKAVSYWCTVERLLEESKGLSITKDQTFLSSLKESVDLFIKDGKATVPGTRPSWEFAAVRGELAALQSSLNDLTSRIGQSSLHYHLLSRAMLLDEDGDSDKLYQVDSGRIGMDTLMALPNSLNRLEAFRHLTLLEWPHKKHKWATPQTLAAAGFYKNTKQDSTSMFNNITSDLVTCFQCQKSLRSWEATDEPWSEHTRHFSECPFVSRQWTNNVPLSVTMATMPAVSMESPAGEPPLLSTSWGCPYVGVTWENGTVAVYDVGKQFYIHEVCAPIKLSPEGLSYSVHFDEVVKGSSDLPVHKDVEDLEHALNGIKAVLADLPPDQDSTSIVTERTFPTSEEMSLSTSSCCVLRAADSRPAPSPAGENVVSPAVLIGCVLTTQSGSKPLVVSHVLRSVELEKNGSPLAYQGLSELHRVTTLPSPNLPTPARLKPVVKDILPVCEGRYVVVSVLYYLADNTLPQEPTTNTKGEEGAVDTGDIPNIVSGVQQPARCHAQGKVAGGQVVLFQVTSEKWPQTPHVKVTCLLNTPVMSKTAKSPEASITSLCQLQHLTTNTDPFELEGLFMAAVTSSGAVQILSGRDLTVIKEVTRFGRSEEPDSVVSCMFCSTGNQLLVHTARNTLQFLSVPQLLDQAEETDDGSTESAKGNKVDDSYVAEEFFKSLSNTHMWLTSVNTNGVPFQCRPPSLWEAVSPEERDKDLPQHVHDSDDTKSSFTRSWIISRNSQNHIWQPMVLELVKPLQTNLGLLKVQLSSSEPELLEKVQVTLLAGEEGKDNPCTSEEGKDDPCASQLEPSDKVDEVPNSKPTAVDLDQQSAHRSTLVGSGMMHTSPDVLETVCDAYSARVIAGPVLCSDVYGITKLSSTLPYFHQSLLESQTQRYFLLVDCPKKQSSSSDESLNSKGKSYVFLTVSFHPLTAQQPARKHRDLVSSKIIPCYIQQLALTASRLRVWREEFQEICDDARKWVESTAVRSHDLSEEESFKAMETLCILAGRLQFLADKHLQSSFLSSLSPVLRTLVHQCFLRGTRQISHKCLRLLRLCQRIDNSLSQTSTGHVKTFSSHLQCALLDNVELVPMATLAVGIRNMFDLIGDGLSMEELERAASVLMGFCGRMMDYVDNLNVMPPLKGLYGVETSIINLNYEHYMFDGGLPSLPCLTADSNHKPTLEYSSQNHNNEMLLFCSGTNTSPVSREEGALSFSDIFFSGTGDRDKKPIELICESMKMSPFLRQPQVGGLDSFELQYSIKEFGQTGPAQSVKVSSRPTSSLSSTRTGGSLLLQSALQPKMASKSNLLMPQDSQWIEEMLPADVAVKLCSNEAQDELVMKTQMEALEDNLFHLGYGTGRQTVELSSVRSGQAFTAVLDFRLPVRLTDLCIPANSMLSSVSVDVWLSEDQQPLRIVHSKDLSSKSVAIGNLSPPPLCQFAKVTFAVGIGKSVPMLVLDLGLFCGCPEISLLAPQVALRLNPLTRQVFCALSQLSHQLVGTLGYFGNSPPLKSDLVATRLIKQAKSLVVEAGGHQFTLSILKCLRNHFLASKDPTKKLIIDPQEIAEDHEGLTSSNKWYSIARRLINKLVCLLQSFREAGRAPPPSGLTFKQAKSLFYTLGLQCYPKVSSRAMSVLVETCGSVQWWPTLVKEIISEVTVDPKPLFYTKKRAFAVLSGFISRSASLDIVSSILDLLEDTLFAPSTSTEGGEGMSSPVQLKEKTQAHHWVLIVFYESLSALSTRDSNIVLERNKCQKISRGIINLITQLVASGNTEAKETIVVASKAVLLLSKATKPVLRFQDVFSADTLRDYLSQCCSSSLNDSIVQAAVESVVLEIFSEDCVYARSVLVNEPLPRSVPETTRPDTSQSNESSELYSLPRRTYSNGDSDEEMVGYLAKKAGLSSVYAEDQYSQWLMHRYARRRRKTKVADSSPSDVEDPPYSSYIISAAVDERLSNTFELQAELDMQVAWKEAYRKTLKFINSCGQQSAPRSANQSILADETRDSLSCVSQNQSILCSALTQLLQLVRLPFSSFSTGRFTRIWWGLTQCTIYSSDKSDLTVSVEDHFSLIEKATSEESSPGSSKQASRPTTFEDVSCLNLLMSSTDVMSSVVQLLISSPHDRNTLLHGVKVVTVILAARLKLKFTGSPFIDPNIDLHLVGKILQNAIKGGGTALTADHIQQVVGRLCLSYEEEDPDTNPKADLNVIPVSQSGILVVMELITQLLKNSLCDGAPVVENASLVCVLECVARFLEGAVLGGWKYQKEKAILSILRCSTLYPTFKDNAVLLFEQYLKILQNHHAEHRRAKAVLSTHESSTRRGYDERHNWTESPQGSSRGLQCISALSQVLQFLVKWECSVDQEEDPDCGVWAELVKNDQFVISLLKVYLMTSHNKEGKYTHVSMILSDLILEVGEARLICPLIEVLKWSRDEESFLPCFTRLVDDISSHSSGSKRSFITALINQGMLQVVLEGFKSSYRSDMSSEPAVLNLPYVWHLFKASSKEAVQNLAEQVLKSSTLVKFLLKGGAYHSRQWRKFAEKQDSEILEVNFKSPVLLHNVQILSQSANGPIAVEVFVRPTKHAPETSESDLLQNFSCGSVKVEFVEPVLCSDLFIHLWKSPSSAAITLSGIVLMGQTLQSVSLSDTSRSQDSGDLGNPWLSFLHWWSQQDATMKSSSRHYMEEHSLQLAQGCLHLLQDRPNPVALKLLGELSDTSDLLGRELLVGCLGIGPLGRRNEFFGLRDLVCSVSLPSAIDLVQVLCDPKTSLGLRRLDTAICVLIESTRGSPLLPTRPSLIKTLASTLWENANVNLSFLEDTSVIMSLTDYCISLRDGDPQKIAMTSLLCAVCAGEHSSQVVRILLEMMEKRLQVSCQPSLLWTLAALIQSERAMSSFLASPIPEKLLSQLTSLLEDLPTSLSTPAGSTVGSVVRDIQLRLSFFTQMAVHSLLAKTWLGRPEIRPLWSELLSTAVLHIPTSLAKKDGIHPSMLAESCFGFFAQACENCSKNKLLLSELVLQGVKGGDGQFTAFHHRLLSDVVLSIDKIPVVLEMEAETKSNTAASSQSQSSDLPLIVSHQSLEFHPSYKASNTTYLCYVPVTMELDSFTKYLCDEMGGNLQEKVKKDLPKKEPPKISMSYVMAEDSPPHGMATSLDPYDSFAGPGKVVEGSLFPPMHLYSTLKRTGRARNKDTLESKAIPKDTIQLFLIVEGKHRIAHPLTMLSFEEVVTALEKSGFSSSNPLSLHLTAIPTSANPLQQEDHQDPRVNVLVSYLQHYFRAKTKPPQLKTPVASGAMGPHTLPTASNQHEMLSSRVGTPSPLEVFLNACRNDGLPCMFPQLYGSVWPTSSSQDNSQCKTIITSPPRGIPFHSLAMLGLSLALPEFVTHLSQDCSHSLDVFILVKVLTARNLEDVQEDLGYSPESADKLVTLPYQLFETAVKESQMRNLVPDCFQLGLFQHLLHCLSHLGSHSCRSKDQDLKVKSLCMFQANWNVREGSEVSVHSSDQEYWAKGTGFGSGSLRSGWNMDRVRERQKKSERLIESILKILSLIMNSNSSPSDTDDMMTKVISDSCLLPALAAYLANDSVLDMSLHIPLYLAVFQTVGCLSRQPSLVGLLLENPYPPWVSEASHHCIFVLMERMHNTAVHFQKASRLGSSQKSSSKAKTATFESDSKLSSTEAPPLLPKGQPGRSESSENTKESEHDVQQLILSIESVWDVLSQAVATLRRQQSQESDSGSVTVATGQTPEEIYMDKMRSLQFDSCELTTVGDNGRPVCVVPYHYASKLDNVTETVGGARVLRITQELTTLANSLPLSASSSVFIRTDEERLDVMKFLITGPSETPYANGCFVFDVFFPPEYPSNPMLVNLETTGYKTVRFNPNLYADGKVCLSVLNTWSGRPEEKWNPNTSSMLQVLVSIQSLIFVSEPYFNEPGYERQRGTPQGDDQCLLYNSAVIADNMKWAILEQLTNPPKAFRTVILEHFYLKKSEVLALCQKWRAMLAEGAQQRQHLTPLHTKLKIIDSLLPQIKKKLEDLNPKNGHFE